MILDLTTCEFLMTLTTIERNGFNEHDFSLFQQMN